VKKIVLIFLIVMIALPVYADNFKDGIDAYKRGDFKTALKNWTIAAQNGNAYAQNNLGTMYESGIGVELDNVEACKWFKIAGKSGYMHGSLRRKNMIDLESKMTPAQIKEVDHLVKEWVKKYHKN
jgi:TPR repeat protein